MRIWALNICLFFMTNLVEKENVQIKYCPTDKMWGDQMTNPTQEANFGTLGNHVLGVN